MRFGRSKRARKTGGGHIEPIQVGCSGRVFSRPAAFQQTAKKSLIDLR
jgi:hypothetical protein